MNRPDCRLTITQEQVRHFAQNFGSFIALKSKHKSMEYSLLEATDVLVQHINETVDVPFVYALDVPTKMALLASHGPKIASPSPAQAEKLRLICSKDPSYTFYSRLYPAFLTYGDKLCSVWLQDEVQTALAQAKRDVAAWVNGQKADLSVNKASTTKPIADSDVIAVAVVPRSVEPVLPTKAPATVPTPTVVAAPASKLAPVAVPAPAKPCPTPVPEPKPVAYRPEMPVVAPATMDSLLRAAERLDCTIDALLGRLLTNAIDSFLVAHPELIKPWPKLDELLPARRA